MKIPVWLNYWKKLLSNSPVKIALYYFLFSFFWILLSDRAISLFVTTPKELTNLQTIKGWLFISGTTLLIFVLVRREIRKKNRFILLLNESNKWYNLLIKNVPNIDVLLLDQQKQIIIAQGNILQKFGWLPHKLQDKFLSDLKMDADLTKLLLHNFNEVINGKSVHDAMDKEGLYLEISGVPVYSDQNELLAVLFVLIDNTILHNHLSEISKKSNEYQDLYNEYLGISKELIQRNTELIESYDKLAESEEK